MNTSIYKVTTRKKGSLGGAAFFLFKNDLLKAVNWEFNRGLTPVEKQLVRQCFPFHVSDLKHLEKWFKVEELIARTAGDKVKLFCMYFKAKRGSNFTPSKAEKQNIKNVVVSKALLEAYFNNDTFPLSYSKSINDYIRHYNYIRDIQRNGTPVKAKFPGIYNREFEKGLSGQELTDYWAHLRKLGWAKNEKGVWVEPGKLNI